MAVSCGFVFTSFSQFVLSDESRVTRSSACVVLTAQGRNASVLLWPFCFSTGAENDRFLFSAVFLVIPSLTYDAQVCPTLTPCPASSREFSRACQRHFSVPALLVMRRSFVLSRELSFQEFVSASDSAAFFRCLLPLPPLLSVSPVCRLSLLCMATRDSKLPSVWHFVVSLLVSLSHYRLLPYSKLDWCL